MSPNQSAMESTDLGVSNGESNFEIQTLGADLVIFRVAPEPKFEGPSKIPLQKY